MARDVGRRRSEEAKSGAGAERVAVRSWSCDGDGARGDSAHGGDGARPMMGGESAEVAAEGLVQDRRANQTGVVAREVEGHVVVAAAAVAVELYNAFAAAAAAAGVVAVVVAAACATCIPSPVGSTRSPLCRVHPARKGDRHGVRGLNLASSR